MANIEDDDLDLDLSDLDADDDPVEQEFDDLDFEIDDEEEPGEPELDLGQPEAKPVITPPEEEANPKAKKTAKTAPAKKAKKEPKKATKASGKKKKVSKADVPVYKPELINDLSIKSIAEDREFQARMLDEREDTDTLDLAQDIKVRGQVTPIQVWKKDGKNYLLSGFRRLAAHKVNGMKNIRAEIWDGEQVSKIRAKALSLGSNFFRKDLNQWEIALDAKKTKDQGIPMKGVEGLVELYGKSEKTIQNWLYVIDRVNCWPELKQVMESNPLSFSVCEKVVRAQQNGFDILKDVLEKSMSTIDCEKLIKQLEAQSKLMELDPVDPSGLDDQIDDGSGDPIVPLDEISEGNGFLDNAGLDQPQKSPISSIALMVERTKSISESVTNFSAQNAEIANMTDDEYQLLETSVNDINQAFKTITKQWKKTATKTKKTKGK